MRLRWASKPLAKVGLFWYAFGERSVMDRWRRI